MKKKLLVLCLSKISIVALSQWTLQPSPTNKLLRSVYFPNKNIGYAVGNSGAIIKTVNGGINWTTQNSGTYWNLYSVFFTSVLNGYAVGDSGTIIKTVNGGTSWTRLFFGTPGFLRSIHFVNSTHGFIAGNWIYGQILKTIDGGAHWDSSVIRTGLELNSIFFTDSVTGYVACGIHPPYNPPGGDIHKTTDGGTSWTYSNTLNTPLLSVFFANDSLGYVAGSGIILRSLNGGLSWDTTVTANYSLNCVHFPGADTGYIVGYSGVIIKTVNRGKTWTALSSGTKRHLYSVYFTDVNSGYAVGDSGTILKTTNGGSFFIDEKKSMETSFMLYPNPTYHKFTLTNKFNIPKETIISIFTIKGEHIFNNIFHNQNEIEIDLCKFEKGIYFVQIRTNLELEYKKVVIQ